MLIRKSSLHERWSFQCDGSVISVSSTPNCSLIAATTVGRSLYLLTSEGDVVWKKSEADALDHEGWCTTISADGSIVVVGTASKIPSDGSIYVFDSSGDLIITKNLGAPVWSLSASQDGKILAATCWNGHAYRFVRTKSGYIQDGDFAANTSCGLYGIQLSRSGDKAVLCVYDTALIVLDAKWNEIGRKPSDAGLYNVAFAEDVELAVAGQRDGTILFYSLSGSTKTIRVKGCTRPICGVGISSMAELIVCGSFDGWVYVIDTDGMPLGRFETDGEVWSVACSDDATLICSGSGDGTVRLIENSCGTAPLKEVSILEKTIAGEQPDNAIDLDRLVNLYGQYGLYEYGYSNLRIIEQTVSTQTLIRKACQQLLQMALNASQDNHWAHYELGLITQAQARHQEAVLHFQRAALHPNYTSRALTHCADSFSSLNFKTATSSCYRRARQLEIDSDAKRALYNLGRSYEDTKQWHEAISHYQLLASWDAGYRNTWKRLDNLLAMHGTVHSESTPKRADYTGITISLLGPDAPRDLDATLIDVLKARTAEILIEPGERKQVSDIIKVLRSNKPYCRGITGTGLDYTQELFLKYDYALPEDETKKFLETVNLLFLLGTSSKNTTLDVGSATGRYPRLMTWLGANAYGIDIERRAVTYAKKLRKSKDWPKYRVGDARKLPFKKSMFDIVTCMMGTFAHIPTADQQNVLEQVFGVLKPGGAIAISTWDRECDHLAYLSIYNENQKDTIRENSPSSAKMTQMLNMAGFEQVIIRPFCMLPQVIVYDLGLEQLRSGDIQLAAQADLAVRSLFPNKHGEMFIASATKPK